VINEAKEMGYNRITLHATQKGKLLFEHCGFQMTDNKKLVMSNGKQLNIFG
jgi:N-acetylglutamate synthase-like GNAT family acetyltransferase